MNKIVENALAAHRAKNDAEGKKVANALTAKQFNGIYDALCRADTFADTCDKGIDDIDREASDIIPLLNVMYGTRDNEASKDARTIENAVVKFSSSMMAAKNALKPLAALIDKMATKYSKYDARLID
jgi:hypothetical protein